MLANRSPGCIVLDQLLTALCALCCAVGRIKQTFQIEKGLNC